MRINKRLSELGICSRREADRWILEKRITINGQLAEMGQQVTEADVIMVDGKAAVLPDPDLPRQVLLAYNKPRGIVCTTGTKDRAENIVDAIGYPERIYPVGRLDKDSEGLILLTNRGELVNRISRARNMHEKEYIVTVDRPLTRSFLDAMADGVYLRELAVKTRPCEVWQDRSLPPDIRNRQFHIVLTQGLNRQIRRMCAELGYTVKRLRRIRIMKLALGNLKPGEYREITDEELGLQPEDASSAFSGSMEYKLWDRIQDQVSDQIMDRIPDQTQIPDQIPDRIPDQKKKDNAGFLKSGINTAEWGGTE